MNKNWMRIIGILAVLGSVFFLIYAFIKDDIGLVWTVFGAIVGVFGIIVTVLGWKPDTLPPPPPLSGHFSQDSVYHSGKITTVNLKNIGGFTLKDVTVSVDPNGICDLDNPSLFPILQVGVSCFFPVKLRRKAFMSNICKITIDFSDAMGSYSEVQDVQVE